MFDTWPVCKSSTILSLILLCSLSIVLPLHAGPSHRQASNKAPLDLDRALAAATKAGDTATVLALLKQGAAINPKENKGGTGDQFIIDTTVLQIAASRDNLAMCKLLIGKGANPNLACVDVPPPLMLASAAGDVSLVNLLLNAGAKVNATSGDLMVDGTALWYAVRNDRLEVAKLLLNKGARINSFPTVSPLMLASASNDTALVKLLLNAGAKTDDINPGNNRLVA